ncbi:MAG TPA: hypothetical protein VGM93_13930, partial [Acidimicrobiales bacterium]
SSLLDGSVGDAAAANDQLLAEAAGDPNVLLGWFGQVCAIRAEQDRVAELVPLAEQTVADHGDLPAVRAVTGWLLAAAGDTAGAWDLIEPLAAVGFRTVPNGWLLPGTLAALAPVVAERGSVDHCRYLLDRLGRYGGQFLVMGSGTTVAGAADRFAGLLLARVGSTAEAADRLDRAADLEQHLRAPLLRAHTLVDRSGLLSTSAEAGDRDVAHSLLDEAAAAGGAHPEWAWLRRRVAELRRRT